MSDGHTFDDLLIETRTFTPSPEFARGAVVRDPAVRTGADADYLAYWERQAGGLDWFQPWHTVLEWKPPHAQWFVGGRLNASYNCLDRHVLSGDGNRAALIWEGEPWTPGSRGEQRTLTYSQLLREVQRFAGSLLQLGIGKGDRVAIYLPMIPEAVVAMLACARIGAIHSVVFGGFSAESLSDRINDSQCKTVITADGGWRRGSVVRLKAEVDKACAGCASVDSVVVVRRGEGDGFPVHMEPGRDHWYHELMESVTGDCPAESMDAEDVLYILYTSGTTGKPKGIVHTTGGYCVHTYVTTKEVFDLRAGDVYWCTADVGWVTGHSYIVYGPLQCGATVLLYEGAPDYPERDRFWDIIERHGVSVFYTAPTAIRAFMKWGTEHPARHNLSSLRLLGSVGEPINPEAWMWYREHIGGGRCPVVDTWWQTETGGIMITTLPGIDAAKPGFAGWALPGISATVLTDGAEEVGIPGQGDGVGAGPAPARPDSIPVREGAGPSPTQENPSVSGSGLLAITRPWPGMLRTIWGDDERYVSTYFDRWKDADGGPRRDLYFPGDGAKRDAEGRFMILGRIDDVLNVAGHRIGTMEVESALVDHPAVAEAAVVGRTHEIKGQAIVAFVTLKQISGSGGAPAAGSAKSISGGGAAAIEMATELKAHVTKKIGAIARPEEIIFTADLPKTRSGKIMRRLLRDIAEGRALGDTTTLADPAVVENLRGMYEDKEG
jgi:acetyl-CoA synthetase